MEIRSYCCCILINCVLLFPSTLSKPVSLNDLIAAEQQSSYLQRPQEKVQGIKKSIRDLPKNYKIFTLTKHMTSGSIAPTNKKLSPLTYKKAFQIRTPLRPKKIKYTYKPRRARINTKREIDNDEKFYRNYIPLLRSLSVLFNNILRTDSGDGDDADADEFSIKQQSDSGSEECHCAHKSRNKTVNHNSTKKAAVVTAYITSTDPTETKTIVPTETSSTSAFNTFDDNFSSLRRNKNIPILSSRDSNSSWRNDNGFGERSLSTHHRNIEGNIAGNNGSYENYHSGGEATKTYSENHGQYTNASTDDGSCNGSCGSIGRSEYIAANTTNEALTTETIIGTNETVGNYRGDSNEFKGFDKFETRGNKTESRILLSESSTRLRRLESQEETTEILWQIESPKESVFDVTYNVTRNQRLFNRNGTMAPEDQEIRGANKKLTFEDFYKSVINTSRSNLDKDKQKIVVIYDGYSVARDVNGENKLTEKAYRIIS